jgi:hypothetical protein
MSAPSPTGVITTATAMRTQSSTATATNPTPSQEPQPRDIALEQETPEQAAELEARSDPEPGDPSEGS